MDETKEKQTVKSNENHENKTKVCQNQTERKASSSNLGVQPVPPDGGWGWIVVFGGFMSMVFIALSLVGFGILFSPILMTLGVSSAKVAWIFSLHGVIWNASVILCGPLCEEFGWRKVAIAGGISNFLSLFLSVFASDANFLFFSFSILGGLGGSAGAVVCQFAISNYFEKHRGFALAIVTLGMGMGSSISPLLANFLLTEYGYKGAMLIFSGIVLNQCVTGALFQPVKWHVKPMEKCTLIDSDKYDRNDFKDFENDEDERNNIKFGSFERHASELSSYSVGALGQSLIDVSSILPSKISNLNAAADESKISVKKEPLSSLFVRIFQSTLQNVKLLRFLRVVIISLGAGCIIIGFVNFQMWIPFVMVEEGYSMQAAAWCVSSANIANIVARLTMSFLSDKAIFSVTKGYVTGILFIGIFILAFSFATNITLMLIFSCCWGFSVGTCMSLSSLVMIKIMGVELFPGVIGVSSLITGVFTITVGPIIGAIRDATSSYFYALLTIVALECLAFGMWMTMPLAIKYDKKKQFQKASRKKEENP